MAVDGYAEWGGNVFLALEPVVPPVGIIAGLLNILTKPKPRFEVRQAMGAKYGVISAQIPAQWEQVTALAGRWGDRLLLPSGVDPPPPLSAARFPRYDKAVLAATACEIIKWTRMPLYRRMVGFCDRDGSYADLLEGLLRHFTAAVVLTGREDVYEAEAERLMAGMGAPVILAGHGTAFADCVLVLAPEGLPPDIRPRCPVLANVHSPDGRHDWISGLRVRPFDELLALCPKGIAPHDFGAALFEFGDVRPAGFVASELLLNGVPATLEQAAETIGRHAGSANLY